MSLNDWLGLVVVGGITCILLILLWVIIRFAIITPMRTRGADRRLRKPQPAEVEKKWRIKLPAALVQFYSRFFLLLPFLVYPHSCSIDPIALPFPDAALVRRGRCVKVIHVHFIDS